MYPRRRKRESAPKAKFPYSKHCIMCHDDYYPEDNGRNSCVIPHTYFDLPQWSGDMVGWEKVYVYKAHCCGNEDIREIGAGNDHYTGGGEPCYTGRHKSNVRQVKENRRYNGKNIVCCEVDEAGHCIRINLVDQYGFEEPCYKGYCMDGDKMNRLENSDEEEEDEQGVGTRQEEKIADEAGYSTKEMKEEEKTNEEADEAPQDAVRKTSSIWPRVVAIGVVLFIARYM